MQRKVLVVTTDPLSEQLPGPAIRAWNLARVLAEHHEVTLVSTVESARTDPRMRCLKVDESNRHDLELWADALVVPAGVLHEWPSLASSDAVVIVDAYDPYHLENLEPGASDDMTERASEVRRMSDAINEHLRWGDHFLCATERQRDFWLGSLASVGRVNPYVYDEDPTMSRLVGIVPFGLPAERPSKVGRGLRESFDGIGPVDKVILWAGGVYNWFDPLSLVSAMEHVIEERPDARLVFMGMGHPNPAIPAMRVAGEARRLSSELGLTNTHVFFNESWVPYDHRAAFLLDADLGVSVHLDHIETRFSFRTRVLDYLWASLPMVLTSGDTLAETIVGAGLGRMVPAGDPPALAEALLMGLADAKPSEDLFDNARRDYLWPTVAKDLVDFLDNPRRAADFRARRDHPQSDTTPELTVVRGDYTATVPSIGTALRGARERAFGGLVRRIAYDTSDRAVNQVVSEIRQVERILGDQGDAADEVAEIIGRTLTRLSSEVDALSTEVARLRERLGSGGDRS